VVLGRVEKRVRGEREKMRAMLEFYTGRERGKGNRNGEAADGLAIGG
jgi:hypothetical protein